MVAGFNEFGGSLVWNLGPLVDHLPIRIRPARPLSDDELFELCARNRDLRIERDPGGELIVMSPTGGKTSRRNANLITQVTQWSWKAGGETFDSSGGFVLGNGAERSPDVAWLSSARWEALSDAQRDRFVPLCPDFVIELLSPSDSLEETHAKMREYVSQGARLGWLIAPAHGMAYVYRPDQPMVALARPNQLTGDPELPGLVVLLDRVW